MRKIYALTIQFKFLIFSLSFFFSLIISNKAFGQTQLTFASSTTFTIPAGVTKITVECWGGGGNGGASTTNGVTASGGGGGAYARKLVTVIQGDSYTVTVGAASGDSWFGTAVTVLAKGGSSVVGVNNTSGSAGGSAAASIGDQTYGGGNGANSGVSYAGGGGSSAGNAGAGNNGSASTNTGGAAPVGGGKGGDGAGSSNNGSTGNNPGGGGGGGWRHGGGGGIGAGAVGQVKITYYSLTGTSAATVCQNSAAIVTLSNSTTTILPVGTYTVTYNLSAPNTATGNIATMNVTTAGTGNFSTAVLPNAGSTTITITNLASGIYSSSIGGTFNTTNFTVSSAAQPTVSAGSTTTFCAGGSVILTSSAASSYKWYNDGVLISSATSQNYSANATAVYSVVVTNGAGCLSAASAGTTVTVNSLPATPTISASGPTTFCADGSLTLTSSSASTYQWYKGGVLINGATNSTYSPTTSGTYTVVVKNAAGCTSATSLGTAVIVNPLPPVPTITGGPTTFCSGLNVVLTSSASSGNKWYDGNGLISGATSTTYTASATSGYLVRVTDVNGCTSISSATNVTVNPLPDITIATQATSLCSSTSSQTTQLAYTNNDNSPTSYSITWSASALSAGFTNVANIGLPASPISISVPANVVANTYSGTLIAKNGNGCQSSSKSFTVTIASSPNVSNFSMLAADGCAGSGAIITVNSSSLGAAVYNVKYDLTGATVSSNNIATITFSGNTGTFAALATNAGATTVTIKEISLVGCATPVSSNNSANFTINALPAVPSISGPGAVCVGATITLNSSSPGGTWESSEPSLGSVNSSGVVSGFINGITGITYTTAVVNGCTNKNTQNITVNALPVVQGITGQTSLCVGTTSTLANLTPNGIWSSSNTSVATIDNTGLVSPLTLGTTIITYTTPVDGNGCANTTNITVNISPDPGVTAGTDLAACESSSPAAITLTGSSYSGGATSALWTIDNGGGTLGAQGTGNSPATVTYTPAANFYGTVTLRLTTNTVGTCGFATATRFINITQKPSATVGSTITVCQNAVPTAIMLSDALVSGSATTGAWSIISGGGTLSDGSQRTDPTNVSYTPTANYSGPVTLRLTTDAVGICGSTFADRTINVTANPTANAGTQPSICQTASPASFALTGASVGGGATTGAWTITFGSGTLSSLAQTSNPAGVSFTPTTNFSGTVKLTLTTNVPAGCASTTAERIIDVTLASTVTSGGANTICQTASALTLTGATVGGGATTGTWSIISGGGVLSSTNPESTPETITYTPDGIYTGNVSLLLTTNATGNCPAVSANRTITVSPNATITLTSAAATTSQNICFGGAIAPITYAVNGAVTGASFSGLPAGVSGSYSGGVITISGTPTLAAGGIYNYTVTTVGSCVQTNAGGSITVNALTVAGTLSPSNSSPLTVCSGVSGPGSILTLSGNNGTVTRWETSTNGGVSWTNIGNANSTTFNYSSITTTTLYRVFVTNGTCTGAFSALGQIVVLPPFTAAITPSATATCIGVPITLTASGYSSTGQVIAGGDFSNTSPPGWGGMNGNNGNNNSATDFIWGSTNSSSHSYNGNIYNSTAGTGGSFFLVAGTPPVTNPSMLTTPVFSMVGLSTAFLVFNQAYDLRTGTIAKIELSTDGGTTYSTLQTYTGVTFQGPTNGITTLTSINLNQYLGLSNLKIRFNYTGTSGSVWALDNVVVTNTVSNPAGTNVFNPLYYTWSPTTYLSSPNTNTTSTTVTVTPTAAGSIAYSVSTSANSCPTSTTSAAVTVTFNPNPIISAMTANPCSETAFTVSPVNGTNGTVPTGTTYSWGLPTVTGAMTGGATGSGAASITGILTNSTSTAQTATYNVTPLSGTCTGASFTVTVTVKPKPTLSSSLTPAARCNNISTTYTATSATTGTTFSWTRTLVTGISNVATSGNSDVITETLVNTTVAPVTVTYIITLTANGCSNTQNVTETVSPTPTLSSILSLPARCNNVSATYTTTTATTGATFSWTRVVVAGINNIAGSGSTATITETLVNTSAAPVNVIYSITLTANGCSNTQNVTATVNPTPTLSSSLTATSCSGSAGGYIAASATAGATFAWTRAFVSGISESASSGASGAITEVLTNTSSLPINVTYVITTSANGCSNGPGQNVVVTVSPSNTWLGVNTNWNDPLNWCPAVPTLTTNVTIPVVPSTKYPIIGAGTIAMVGNITIANSAFVTVIGNTGTLQVGGTIINSGTFDVSAGTLEFKGSSPQSFSGNLFVGNALKNLTVSNTNLTVSGTAVPLNITGELAFGVVSNADFKTGDNVVLVSNIAGTARVADITNGGASSGNKFTGKVTVERYYLARRSWRLVTSPLSNTGSIFSNWQESAPSTYVPGRGTFITGPTPTVANGLDTSFQNHYSIKGWRASDGTYVNIGNTISTNLSSTASNAANIGYYLFVRGDRNRTPDNTIIPNQNETTLSSKGNLQTGSQTFGVESTPGTFTLIGNPFASSIDFNKITKVNVYPRRFYTFDPKLGTIGLFVVMEDLSSLGSFTPTVQTTSTQGNFIQSSQAFFVENNGVGTASITIEEQHKSNNYNPNLFRPAKPLNEIASLRTNLLQLNSAGSNLVVDGFLAAYDNSFNSAVDIQDAMKFTNINENLGLKRDGKILCVERRPLIIADDTLFIQISRTTQRRYRLAFEPANLDPLLTAFLEDSYTGTKNVLSVTSNSDYDFEVNGDATSSATNRFKIVFKKPETGPLPVTYKNINAYQQQANIAVEWTVENELNISKYEVEKSTNGINYVKVNTSMAVGSGQNSTLYKWLDINPVYGNNFYRIRGISLNGKYDYSKAVVVKISKGIAGIAVYPNPVINGTIGLAFNNMPGGIYKASLFNSIGQTILNKQINHTTGTSLENIHPDYQLVSDIYKLEITTPDKTITTIKLLVK